MAATRKEVGFLIRTAQQVRALRSPMRQEIVDALESAGACSAAELGALLGRAPDSLYFHLKALVKVGLVVEREPRKEGRHVAAVYDLTGRPMRLSYEAPIRREDVARVVAGAIRLSMRDFERGLREGGVASGDRRTVWGGRAKGWVGSEELERVNALLAELQEVVRSGKPGAGAVPVSLGFVLAPSPPTKRAAVTSKKGSAQ